jgi:hypothetical protein
MRGRLMAVADCDIIAVKGRWISLLWPVAVRLSLLYVAQACFVARAEEVVTLKTVLAHVDGDSQGSWRANSEVRQLGSLR